MDFSVVDYIIKNTKELGQNDFNTFIESPGFNAKDMKDESKRLLFYINIFIMSTNNYKSFKNIIDDFIEIIDYISYNDYVQNIHESYEATICNYLKKIELLSRKAVDENENEFIQNLNKFVEDITKMYFPVNNNKMKLNIAECLKNIEIQLVIIKKEISKENINKFERYRKDLNEYINNLTSDINENKNDIIINQIPSQNLPKNLENNINGNYNIQNTDISKNIDNNFNQNIPNNNQIRNDYVNNNYNQINNNKVYSNIKYNYSKNSNKILDNESHNYNIIYNSIIPGNNYNYNNINNYDSMVVLKPKSIESNSEEDETEEEEKLKEKYEEVDNYIDSFIIPNFFSNNNNENINNLKENLMVKEENEDLSQNNSQKSQSNISTSSKNKKKKKKKKKKNNNQNQNLNNNLNQNYNYNGFIPNNISNIPYPYPYPIQPQIYIHPQYAQMQGINNGFIMNPIPNNNNFNLQNQYYSIPINNNVYAPQNPNFQMKKNKKKK